MSSMRGVGEKIVYIVKTSREAEVERGGYIYWDSSLKKILTVNNATEQRNLGSLA